MFQALPLLSACWLVPPFAMGEDRQKQRPRQKLVLSRDWTRILLQSLYNDQRRLEFV